MEGEIVSKPTIQSVNDNLLQALDYQIKNCESVEALSTLSDSVAKLNSSYKNNDLFPRPETAEERAQREMQEIMKGAMSGEN